MAAKLYHYFPVAGQTRIGFVSFGGQSERGLPAPQQQKRGYQEDYQSCEESRSYGCSDSADDRS
jgi:hypothetical protein